MVDKPVNKSPMKPATLGNTTRTLGKVFFGFVLLALAIAAGFGGTALIVYHQLGGSRAVDVRVADRTKVERKEPLRLAPPISEGATERPQPRRVAVTASDASSYRYADNMDGQITSTAKRQRPVSNVPAALEVPARAGSEPPASENLNDPESRYIVDSRTGKVIGIDGTVGARHEAEEEQRRIDAAPRAIAIQTPVPEVRVASAVVEDGQPVYHEAQPSYGSVGDPQYVPVRRAVPVTNEGSMENPRGFNVAEYLASDRRRPVLRAQPVNSAGTRTVVRATHVFRLPDGTQATVAD